MSSKKFFFCVCMYKVVEISKEGYKKDEVEIIDKGRYFCVNRKDLEVETDVANFPQIFEKCDSKKQKSRQELAPNAEHQRCMVFVRNDIVETKIKSCRNSSKRLLEFAKKLGLDPDVVTCDEQNIVSALQVAFEEEVILTQYCIENKRLDVYFFIYKLGIEIDEYNHEGSNYNYEKRNEAWNYYY